MTSESKILTVSYGTFSCTLEGFDNPFDTMKAIAEYFRDLAAQDRHFGAEPPPPDAAMLHRLAEREVSRLAASRAEESARLQVPADTEADAAPAPRIQINPTGRRPAPPPVQDEVEEDIDVASPEPSLTDVIPDGVAAKLARIRRSVHPTVAEAAAPLSAFLAEDLPPAPEPLDDVALAPSEEPIDLATATSDVAARLGELIADGAAARGYDVEDAIDTPVEPPVADPWAEDDADVIEAEAIEVEAEPVEALDSADGVETVEAEAEEFDAASLVEAESDLSAALPEDEIAAIADTGLLDEDDLTSEDVAMLAQLDGTVFDEASLAAELDETLPESQPAALSLSEAELQDPVPEATLDEALDDMLPEELEAAPALDEMPVEAPVAAEAAPEVAPEEIQPVGKSGSKARRVNSRVVRIHPSEDAPGMKRDPAATRVMDSTEEQDEIARLMQQAEEVMAEEENRRRQEALSRLKAAVVATEADRADIDYEAPRVEASLDPYRDDLAEAIQPEAAPEPAPEPEVKPARRKSVTIRPAEPRPGTIRPGLISPPPLVLVSEQRIDRVPPPAAPVAAPAAAPSMAPPVPGIGPSEGQPMVALRTGRLSGAIGAGAAVAASSLPARNLVLEKPSYGTAAEAEEDEDLAEDSKEIDEAGFASFAEMVGARSMAEMLEAAAAFATCVEKRSQFTRPQLMRRMMASAGGKPVSREDGLRSFGTLLRTGRIEKVTRGHYCLAENSPYLAEARRFS